MEMRIYQRSCRNAPFPIIFDDDESIFELATKFLWEKAQNPRAYSSKTIELYAKNLKYFSQYLRGSDHYKSLSLDQIVSAMPAGVLNQYLRHERELGLGDATCRSRDVTLKLFFDWLTTNEAGRARQSSGYDTGLKTAAPKSKTRRYVLPDQVVRLLLALHHESQRCLIHVMYDVGLRVSEVPRIQKADVDALAEWSEDYAYLPLLVRGSKGRVAGNIKERYALISRAAYNRVTRYHSTLEYRAARVAGGQPAFLNTKGAPITTKAIQKSLAQAQRRAGFAPREISAHRLRHGTALSFLTGEFGANYLDKMVALKVQLGHSSVKTTEGYANIPPSMFMNIEGEPVVRLRYAQAQEIYDKTFLPRRHHRVYARRPA